MTGATAVGEQHYDFHGTTITVSPGTPAIADAMELRLRAFRGEPPKQRHIRFEFMPGGRLERPRGESRPVYDTPYGSVEYFAETDTLWGELDGLSMICDASGGCARIASDGFEGRALYLATHPLATIALMELLKRRGRYTLHAGCLASPGGDGLLVAGPSGAGKSTLTIALVRAGAGFLSDDLVFLEHDVESAQVRALGFADSLGVTEQTAGLIPELRPLLGAAIAAGFPKRLARLDQVFPGDPLPSCTPRVLVLPHVAPEGESRVEPLDPRDAWLRLVPDVLLTEPGSTQAHLRALSALLDQADCYSLQSGADLDAAARLALELL